MAPSGSKLIGNATIWDKSGEPVDGFDTAFLASGMYSVVYEEAVAGASFLVESMLEGPPDFTEFVSSTSFIAEIDLFPPPGYSDPITGTSHIENVRLFEPDEFDDTVTGSSRIVIATLRTAEDPDPPPVISYTRWPVEEVTGSSFIEEVLLYEPE